MTAIACVRVPVCAFARVCVSAIVNFVCFCLHVFACVRACVRARFICVCCCVRVSAVCVRARELRAKNV